MQTPTQIQFKMLTKTEQVVNVLKNGKPVGRRSMNEFSVKLYLYGNIFVELWYAGNGKEIVKVRQVSVRTVKRLYGAVPSP